MRTIFKSAFVSVGLFAPLFSSHQFGASFGGQVFGTCLIIAILCIFILPRVWGNGARDDVMSARESFQRKLMSLKLRSGRRGITEQTRKMLDNISDRFEPFHSQSRDAIVSWTQVKKDLSALRDELEALAVIMNQEASLEKEIVD